MVALHSEIEGVEHGRPDRPVERCGGDVGGDLAAAGQVGEAGIVRRARHGVGAQIPGTVPGELICDLVIDASRGIDRVVRRGLAPLQREVIRVVDVRDRAGAFRDGSVDGIEDSLHGRIDLAVRQLQHVLRTHRAVGGDVAVDAPLGRFGQHVDGPVRRSRPRPVLDIDKEEELVFHARNRQRTAQVAAEIVLADLRPDLAARVAEERVGVESVVAQLMEQAAMILAGAALGGEADVHGAAGGGVRARARGGGGDFFNGVDSGRRESEEAGAAALEALRVVVDAVDGDVQRGVG